MSLFSYLEVSIIFFKGRFLSSYFQPHKEGDNTILASKTNGTRFWGHVLIFNARYFRNSRTVVYDELLTISLNLNCSKSGEFFTT